MNVLFKSVTNHSVNQRRRVGLLRIGLVLITSVSWVAIANHCALTSLFTTRAETITALCHHCAGEQSPVKSQNDSGSECCKTLHATLVAGKKLVDYDAGLWALQPYFVAPLILRNEPKVTVPGRELDTGPPFAKTFAESILQRSILAHAPPSLA